MKFLALLFCAIALAAVSEGLLQYENYRVYRVNFSNEEQFAILQNMHDNDEDVMFWQLSHAEHCAEIMVGPKALDKFLGDLKSHGFTYELMIKNVQDTINAERF